MQLVKIALPFSLIFVYTIVYDKLPSILVALFSGKTPAAAGWFNSIYNIMTVLTTIPSIVISTVFPLLARKSQQNQQSVDEISTHLVKYIAIISFGLAIAFFVLAPQVIPLLFGDAYRPSIWILQVQAVGIPFLFLPIALISMMEAVGQQQICARYAGYALVFAIPVSLFAIWKWGYMGGTMVYVLDNVFLFVVMLWLARRTVGNIRLRQAFFSPVAAGLATLFFIVAFYQWPFYFLLPLVAAIYLLVLVFSGAVGSFEVEMLGRIWQGRSWPDQAKPSVEPVADDDALNLP
jgi:O-antigen/teichoic acid export membrane protein